MLACTVGQRKFLARFFFNDTATTEIYTLSLHDALPILCRSTNRQGPLDPCRRYEYWIRSQQHRRPHLRQAHADRLERGRFLAYQERRPAPEGCTYGRAPGENPRRSQRVRSLAVPRRG